MSLELYLSLSDEVKAALAGNKPIVALESTIITHGMPYPQNLETAIAVEDVVRANGAVPATIAIMGGKLKVGLGADDLEALAKTGRDASKASRRDLAAILAQKATAGTTVATTMMIAAMAGIKIFATGGIGGVHRGAEHTFDISADLIELSRTPVAVVCAGAKSILDIAKTLEVLETHGVPVLGYKTKEFPAFFARESGSFVDYQVDSAEEIANIIRMQNAIGLSAGILIGNPIPQADALDAREIGIRIDAAIADAEAQGIERKEVTPYLLNRVFELTEGKSLVANIALVKNNAALAAQIAKSLYRE